MEQNILKPKKEGRSKERKKGQAKKEVFQHSFY